MDTRNMETRYYEGCGREGPIRCIFLCEFHPVAGPKIICQFPDEYLAKEIFDTISVYIIPKPQVQKCILTINAFGHKILGYPIRIDDDRYQRNAYLFNLCFVCDSWSRTVQYEPVVKKLGEHLKTMEQETKFVSSGSSKLPTLLAHLLHDLNTHRRSTVVGDTLVHLKVLELRKDPPPVHDQDVPVFVWTFGKNRSDGSHKFADYCDDKHGSVGNNLIVSHPQANSVQDMQEDIDQQLNHTEGDCSVLIDDEWDLTTRKILPYIDGSKHVLQIAAEADIEKNLVKSCLQNLVYYGVVSLLPILLFSNSYRATPALSRLINDTELQRTCLNLVRIQSANHIPGPAPTISGVLSILCSLQQGMTLKMVCEKNPAARCGKLDIRRLIVFALHHGLIKCIKRYPVHTKQHTGIGLSSDSNGIRSLFTGRHSLDEICCISRLPMPLLEKLVEEDSNVLLIHR